MNKKKLRIAIVSDAVYPYNIGGKEKRIYELTKRLAVKGHHVTVYTMHWWKTKDMRIEHDGVVYEAISPLYPLYAGPRRSIKEAILFSLHCFQLLNKSFDILDADHMPHLILFPIKLVCLLKRKKMYVTWNEVWGRAYWVQYLGLRGHIAYIVEFVSAHLADEIISISAHTTKKLRHELCLRTKIVTIPMGIDLDYMARIKPAKETSDILYAGRLLENKNVATILRAVSLVKKNYPHIKAIIIGNGPEEKNLYALSNKLKIASNIIFKGFLPTHDDLYAYMKSSKVFLFPSTREGFGIVALEALAAGLPVITTDHNDNAAKELVKNGKNGYVIPLNATIIAAHIEKILHKKFPTDPSKVSSYDWNNLSLETERAYLS